MPFVDSLVIQLQCIFLMFFTAKSSQISLKVLGYSKYADVKKSMYTSVQIFIVLRHVIIRYVL